MAKRNAQAALFRRIQKLGNCEMNETIRFIAQVYEARYPNYEIVFVSLPKDDPMERKRLLESFLAVHEEWIR